MNKESILLEGVNGNFLALSICAVFWFSYYIWANWKEGYIFLRPAIALAAIFLMESVLRGNFWFARHTINGGNIHYQASSNVTIFSSLGCSWAILCVIAVFAPTKYRTFAWASSALCTVIFLVLTLTRVI